MLYASFKLFGIKINKVLWILVQKLYILRKWTIKVEKSMTTHSIYGMERKQWGLQNQDSVPPLFSKGYHCCFLEKSEKFRA